MKLMIPEAMLLIHAKEYSLLVPRASEIENWDEIEVIDLQTEPDEDRTMQRKHDDDDGKVRRGKG